MQAGQQRTQRIGFLRKLYNQCKIENKTIEQTTTILRNYCRQRWALPNRLINDYINCVMLPWADVPKIIENDIVDESKDSILDESKL